jgi:hypothetical protein
VWRRLPRSEDADGAGLVVSEADADGRRHGEIAVAVPALDGFVLDHLCAVGAFLHDGDLRVIREDARLPETDVGGGMGGRTFGSVAASMGGRVAVLVSGGGTNLQALLDDPQVAPHIALVLSDRPSVRALERATARDVAVEVVEVDVYPDRDSYTEAVRDVLLTHGIDTVVLAGFMRVLSGGFFDAFPGTGPERASGAAARVPGFARRPRRPGLGREGHRGHRAPGR